MCFKLLLIKFGELAAMFGVLATGFRRRRWQMRHLSLPFGVMVVNWLRFKTDPFSNDQGLKFGLVDVA